jgi:hypothetical protein
MFKSVQTVLRPPVSALFLVVLITRGVPSQTAAQVSTEKPPTMSVIPLQGTPQGGGLKLWIKARVLEVATRPGEDLAQIAKDAAEKINTDPEMRDQGITAKTQRNELTIDVNEVWVFLCATDKGLGVPPAPYGLRVRREGDGVFHLSWKLPPGGYDRIHVLRGTVPIADGINGTNTTFGDVAPGERQSYRVFGIKNGIPSCAATL